MKRIAVLFSLLLALTVAASAQMTMTGVGGGFGVAAGGAYSGPGDVVSSATTYWGLRAYSAAMRGTRAINLCDDLGANCSDISTNASTGVLNAGGTHGANNCDVSGTCRIAIVYDQTTGNNCTAASCDLSNATNANRPVFTPNCTGSSKPCMTCPGTVTGFATQAGILTLAQPFTISGYAKRTGGTSAFGDVLGVAVNVQFLFNSAVNQFTIYAGTVATAQTANDNAFHALQGAYSGASSVINVDGTGSGSVNAGTVGMSGSPELCNGNNALTGAVTEVGIWPVAFNGTQQGNMNTNQVGFW